jgi:hypothetical protein
MPILNADVVRVTQSRKVTADEAPIVFFGWGREREQLGDEQTCYNAPKYNGYVDGVFIKDVIVTNIHRYGQPTGWFSIRELGMKRRTFYVEGRNTVFMGKPINDWWK